MNFPKHTTKKGTHMPDREQSPKHTAKTPSHRTGIFATLRALLRGQGTGAPSSRRAPIALITALAVIASFAITAAPASADPVAATCCTVPDVSYTSAQVAGSITSPEEGAFGFSITTYTFQYSTDETNWSDGYSESLFNEGAFVERPVQGTIPGLNSATKYFLRLKVSNNGKTATSSGPNPSFTTLTADPPTIPGAPAASAIFSTSAAASAEVRRPAASDDVTCQFEYVDDTEFGANGFANATVRPCAENPIGAADTETDKEVTAHLGCTNPALEDPQGACLKPATTYHLRLLADNAAPGTVTKEALSTFTTAAKVAAPSVLITTNATDVGFFSAKVSGEVQRPAGDDPALDVNCRFEYVTDEQFNDAGFENATRTDCLDNLIEAADPPAAEAELTGLRSGTTYHWRLTAENGGGTDSKDAASTFTTTSVPQPALTIEPPSAPGYAKAHLSGTVDPEGGAVDPATAEPFPINWNLQYQLASEPGNWQNGGAGTIAGAEATGSDPIAVEADLEGLALGTEYKVRLFVTYADREATSTEDSFTTQAVAKPVIALDPVTDIADTTAKFTGTVSANAPGPVDAEGEALYKTDWSISCEPACPKLSGGGAGSVAAGDGVKALSIDATKLEPNIPYEVTLKASNAAGTEAVTRSFHTTAVGPTVLNAPGAPDGKAGYVLQGVVNPHNSPVSDCHFVYGPNSEVDPKKYAFVKPCSPTPSGRNEVQTIRFSAFSGVHLPLNSGQFRLSFRGQTTGDLPYNATPAEVEDALKALSTIGPDDISITGSATGEGQSYEFTFEGSLAETRLPLIQGENGTIPLGNDPIFGADLEISIEASTVVLGGNNFPVTVEGHVTGLTPDATYHSRLVVTNAFGTVVTPDQTFVPTLEVGQNCPNEDLRKENSSEALPECRAYEQVTNPSKLGIGASLSDFSADGDTVLYKSGGANIAGSGSANLSGSTYATVRSDAGWKTIADLNGPLGSIFTAPDGFTGIAEGGTARPLAYSSDFSSSVWWGNKLSEPAAPGPSPGDLYLRHPDGTFTKIGNGSPSKGSPNYPGPGSANVNVFGVSDDLSHVVVNGVAGSSGQVWGPGVYEFVGIGNDQPDRVDVDNTGTPISACAESHGDVARAGAISQDGRTLVFEVNGGCGGPNSPAKEVWARVGGTASFDVSASQCTRGDCNAPADAIFRGAAEDGSRVFFTTTQQLVDGDTDQTNDLYACDIPSGNPAPTADKANPCASLLQVSGAQSGAEVENVSTVSEDGSTALLTAKGVLADNEDSLQEKAEAGDHNLYLWRADASHTDGQITFLARLGSDDLAVAGPPAQFTPDGRYLVFTTANQLVPTDTDTARDVYRYDADPEELTRVSVGTSGASGNADAFSASIIGATDHESHPALADDGSVVFTTAEPLSPLDGNGESDVYLWSAGHVYLISTGAAGGGSGTAGISGSGRDIYFDTTAQLTPSDLDIVGDAYDARIEGGFTFATEPGCVEETCQPPAPNPPAPPNPGTAQPGGEGNVKPCPKSKVRKHGKCVKKSRKGHSGKKRHPKNHNRAGSNGGGGK